MNHIYWLSQIKYSERFLVGNKLFILSQLLQNDCLILPGFVLGRFFWRQYRTFIAPNLSRELAKLTPTSYVGIEQSQALQEAARKIIQLIIQNEFPLAWQEEIYRAGQQLHADGFNLQICIVSAVGLRDFYPSRTCNNHPLALVETIKLLWSDFFSASSLVYWLNQGWDLEQIDLAIKISPLQQVWASGQIELKDDLVQIKTSWGDPLSLTRGDVETDQYDLDRETYALLRRHLGHKNYGYRLKSIDLNSPLVNCLEAYVPSEKLTAAAVLNSASLVRLLSQMDLILRQRPQLVQLDWIAYQVSDSEPPQFYFTRLEEHIVGSSRAISSSLIPQTATLNSTPLVAGVGVATGLVQGMVLVIDNLDDAGDISTAETILVTSQIEPRHLARLKQLKGIITEIGGTTSHGAIIARELGIPAIVEVVDATKILHTGESVVLDGSRGKVFAGSQAQLALSSGLPAQVFAPSYPIATKLMLNISQVESISGAVHLPVDGVGLLRSELMLANLIACSTFRLESAYAHQQFTSTLKNHLRQFAIAFGERPVYYRSLEQNLAASTKVSRGTYNYLLNPTLFQWELEVLGELITEGHANLHLILPFVRSVAEFKYCYRQIQYSGLRDRDSFQVWIMAEIPSVTVLLPEYVQAGVQGIAIGTNDLTQLFLGIDREQEQFRTRGLHANHLAMQRILAELVKLAHSLQIPCCICGQAPVEHPELIEQLVAWGIDAISVEPEAIRKTYRAISRAEKRLLLGQIRSENLSEPDH